MHANDSHSVRIDAWTGPYIVNIDDIDIDTDLDYRLLVPIPEPIPVANLPSVKLKIKLPVRDDVCILHIYGTSLDPGYDITMTSYPIGRLRLRQWSLPSNVIYIYSRLHACIYLFHSLDLLLYHLLIIRERCCDFGHDMLPDSAVVVHIGESNQSGTWRCAYCYVL